MSYRAIDIANWFISQFDPESGDVITHLKVQKLLYYAQAWNLVFYGRPIFDEGIEAWSHGPVVREVFDQFSDCGWNPLTATEDVVEFDDDSVNLLSEVLTAYGSVAAKTLERMTHEDEPWIEARRGLAPEERCDKKMGLESIGNYFKQKYGDQLDEGKS